MDLATLVTLLGLFSVTIMLPGPNALVIAGCRLSAGRLATRSLVAGICAGELVWSVASVFGAAVLLERHPSWLTCMRLASAAWLVVLGVQLLRPRAGGGPGPTSGQAPGTPKGRHFGRGLVTSALSPANVVFFVVVLPPLLASAALSQSAACATIVLYTGIAALWYGSLGAVVAFASSLGFTGSATLWVVRGCGVALVGFGAAFALSA